MRASLLAVSLVLPLLAACTTAEGGATIGKPFSYSRDRCVGSFNQCSVDCASIDDDGPARSACTQRCLSNEDRCYLTGDDGSALAVQEGVAASRREQDKERAFREWKAQRERERAAAEKDAEPKQ